MLDLIAFLTAFVSLVGNVIQIIEKRRIKRGIDQPVELPSGTRRSSIIVVGLGGSGKTTFINTLLGAAIPIEKTKRYELYRGEKLVPLLDNEGHQEGNVKHYFFISDYVGQNLGTLISSFIWQQKRLFSPISYGHINALIVMVDLFGMESRKNGEPDPGRIQDHIEQWNATALDAVWGLLREESLRYVCLFINKVDEMHDNSRTARAAYAKLFSKLDRLLKDRAKPEATGVDFEVFLGSARGGFEPVIGKLLSNSVDSQFIPEMKEEPGDE